MMREETIRLGSGRVWHVYSTGSGPELIWLHGLRGVDPADPFLAALAERYHVTAPVAPGFSDLDELEAIDNIHELALDYDDLLASLDRQDVSLVGHSFGGMIAAEIAAHFRDRATRLVLLAPLGLWNEAYPVADIFALPYANMDDLLWHDAQARKTFTKPATSEADAKQAAEQMITLARSLTAVTKFMWPIPDRGLRRRLPRITAPTLAVFGANDAFLPARYAEDFAAGLKHGQTAVIQGAGHMLAYEQPAQVMNLIDEFMRRAP